MFDTLSMLWKRYHLPMFVTENGMPDETDQYRPQFIVNHLNYLWKSLVAGIPVLGYYYWSLLDNFEWTEGYDPRFRFGLIGVDFSNQKRYMRTSGALYAEICRAGELTSETVEKFTPSLVSDVFGA
jgi:beta-glucosidase